MSNTYDFWFWENVFNKKQITEINKFIEKNFDKFEDKENAAVDNNNNSKKNSLVKCIQWHKIKPLLNYAHTLAISSARMNFGYDVFEVSDIDSCLLNTYSYKNKSKYDWHVDMDRSDLYDIKLTVLINLSLNSFEGGDFKLFKTNEFIIPYLKNPGNMIMFKSQINHCVTPVTKGERKTFTIFVKGPKFR
jgi:hypothetical protein